MGLAHDFWRSKTTWTGVLALVAAAAGYLTGELSTAQAVAAAFAAIQSVWLRDAVRKSF